VTAILLVGFGLTVFGIFGILAAIYFAWRHVARELDDVRKREKARERVYQLMTTDDPEPADEPSSAKRRGHLRVIKVVAPIALLLGWLRVHRQEAVLAAGGLAIAAVAGGGLLLPSQQPPIPTPSSQPSHSAQSPESPQSLVIVPTTMPTLVPTTMPLPSSSPGESGVQPSAPTTTSTPPKESTPSPPGTVLPSLSISLPPLLPSEDSDCTIQVLGLCVPPII
jgi:hypothetical protein